MSTPSIPTEHFLPSIREPSEQALLKQLQKKGRETTYEFQGMVFKLNKKKTRFILKYREDPCIVCYTDGADVEHHLGFRVLACGHYNTCVTENRLYRCPTCRFAFKCWWCSSTTDPDTQPAPRDNLFDQWGPLIWNAQTGFCGICKQELSRDVYINRLITYDSIDKIARVTGQMPDEFVELPY